MDGRSAYGRVEGWRERQRVDEMVKWRQGGKWEGEQKRNGGRERETETDRQTDRDRERGRHLTRCFFHRLYEKEPGSLRHQ